MKKTKSMFFKVVLFMTPIILVLDLVMIFLSYSITYENTLEHSKSKIKKAAEIALQYTQNRDPSEEYMQEALCEDYDYFCDIFDITYIFSVSLDPVEKTETYIAIGFGKSATKEAKETRFPGVVVRDSITEEELEAFNGKSTGVFSHEKSTFGESLIYYLPMYKHYDAETSGYVELDQPVIIAAEISITKIISSVQDRFRMIAVITIVLTLLIVAAFSAILYFRVSKPVRKISNRMSHFVTDRENEKSVEKLEVKGNDEFALMAESFNIMTDEIDRYIDDIDELNREKHTQEAELHIARDIQKGLLQPDRTDNDTAAIRAYMLPAKNVGGDLYDYSILDDGRIFVAIADVSGKGISAALYMARAITLLHQYAQTNCTPAHILGEYNNTLATYNPGGLFITTFIAFWDPATCELTYSNAGHNIPYILSDTLVPLEGAHGVAAGLFEGEEYEEAVAVFKPGETLFLYTDGVNEAKSAENAFYLTERLEEKLSECIRDRTTEVLDRILSDLKRFTENAEQNDDITMLTLHLKPQEDQLVLHLKSELSQLERIKEAIFSLPIGEDKKKTIYLAAEEMFVNICSYAYDEPGDVELRIADGDEIRLTLTDGGKPFDPTSDQVDIDEYDHENAIGGLGRFLTFSIAERYHYAYSDGKNILDLYFSRGD